MSECAKTPLLPQPLLVHSTLLYHYTIEPWQLGCPGMVNSTQSLIFSKDSMPIEIKKSLGLGSQLTGTQNQLITS
jgi:hypothetical protein